MFSQRTRDKLTDHKSNRQWRERQAEEIKARDERSKTRRQETISKAERSIDQFYEDYNGMRKRQIRENKCVFSRLLASFYVIDDEG